MKKAFFPAIFFLVFITLVSAQDTIAYYPFISDANDASGNGYNGALYGGASANDTLETGDNASDYVSLPPDILTGLNDLTITFIVKFITIHTSGSYPANTVMHAWGMNNQDEFKLSYNHNYSVFQVGVKTNQVTFPFTATADQWYCFCIVRESNEISFYVDGTQAGLSQYSGGGSLSPSASGFVLGQEEDCMGACFVQNQSLAGKIDELNFYNYAFNAQQVSSCVSQTSFPSFTASSSEVCEKFCVDFTDQSNNNPVAWQWLFPGGAPSSSTSQNPTSICYAVPGMYDVTLITTNANGTDTTTFPNFITVNETPPFPVISQTGYTLTSSAADAYQWQFNSADIIGATNQSYIIMQTGFYSVIVSDTNGCKNSTSIYMLISDIIEITGKSLVTVSPNPADDEIIISFPSQKIISILLLNELAEVVKKIYVINGTSATIPTKNLSAGIYLLKLESENHLVSTVKLIVEHR